MRSFFSRLRRLSSASWIFCFALSGLTTGSPVSAQLWNVREELQPETVSKFSLLSGLGWTRIVVNSTGNPVHYATLSLAPTFSVGKISAGFNIDMLFNTASDPGGSIVRQSELKVGHLIRFVRYGNPSDATFFHVGALERTSIGHGWLVSRYSNQVTDQSRRTGLWAKLDRPIGGVEAIVSNLGAAEIYGGRFFLRPFNYGGNGGMVGRLAVGATILLDDDPGRGRTRTPRPSVGLFGLDIEFPLIKKEKISLIPYGDFGKILDSGSGFTAGVQLNVAEPGDPLYVRGRLAHQTLGKGFAPAFFEETYETVSILGSGTTKTEQLRPLPGAQGAMGEMEVTFLRRLLLSASYRNYGGRSDGGVFHAEAHIARLIPNLTLHAVYDKQNIRNFGDIRTLDDRSVVMAEIQYRLHAYLVVGIDYRWTFVFDEAPDILTYRPIERIYPKVVFACVF